MRSVRLPLLVSITCFVLAAILATLAWRRAFPEVTVVVPKTDLPAGTQLSAENLMEMPIPRAALPAQPVAWNSAVGQWTAVPVFQGEPLTHNRIQDAPPSKDEKVSYGVLAIPVNGQYALGGKMMRGDRVDIIFVPPRPKDDKAPVDENRATVLLRSIRVVDVRNSSGQSAAPVDDKNEGASSPLGMPVAPGNGLPATVILDVDERQALQLVNAIEAKSAIYFYRNAAGGQ